MFHPYLDYFPPQLTESNDYVSALELSMNLGIMPQPPEKVCQWLIAGYSGQCKFSLIRQLTISTLQQQKAEVYSVSIW